MASLLFTLTGTKLAVLVGHSGKLSLEIPYRHDLDATRTTKRTSKKRVFQAVETDGNASRH
jgi:hypothetical protein